MLEARQRNPRAFINSKTGLKQVDWSPQELQDILEEVTSLRDRAYMSFVYLTGCRSIEPLEHTAIYKVLIRVPDGTGRMRRVWNGETDQVHIPPFLCRQIVRVTRVVGENLIPFIDFQNLYVGKTRHRDPYMSVRTVPVNALKYKRFLEFIFEYIHAEEKKKDDPLFTETERTFRKKVNYWIGTTVHYLRHLRSTHLVTVHNYTDQDLKNFIGWKDTRPASTYVHLNPDHLARKQVL